MKQEKATILGTKKMLKIFRLSQILTSADLNPARITKAEKDFTKRFDFKDIKFAVKVKDIHKIEKKEFHQY